MKVNINDKVRVRLTRRGANLFNTGKVALNLPDGSDWAEPGMVIEDQLWVIMSKFGPYMALGVDPVIETEIELLNV